MRKQYGNRDRPGDSELLGDDAQDKIDQLIEKWKSQVLRANQHSARARREYDQTIEELTQQAWKAIAEYESYCTGRRSEAYCDQQQIKRRQPFDWSKETVGRVRAILEESGTEKNKATRPRDRAEIDRHQETANDDEAKLSAAEKKWWPGWPTMKLKDDTSLEQILYEPVPANNRTTEKTRSWIADADKRLAQEQREFDEERRRRQSDIAKKWGLSPEQVRKYFPDK